MALVDGSNEFTQIGTRDALAENTEGEYKVAIANYTHSGAGEQGEINLFSLPAGRIRIHLHLSFVSTSQWAASSLFKLGVPVRQDEAGNTLPKDEDPLISDLLAGVAPQNVTWGSTVGTNPQFLDFNTATRLILVGLIEDGDIESGDTLDLVCVYSRIS